MEEEFYLGETFVRENNIVEQCLETAKEYFAGSINIYPLEVFKEAGYETGDIWREEMIDETHPLFGLYTTVTGYRGPCMVSRGFFAGLVFRISEEENISGEMLALFLQEMDVGKLTEIMEKHRESVHHDHDDFEGVNAEIIEVDDENCDEVVEEIMRDMVTPSEEGGEILEIGFAGFDENGDWEEKRYDPVTGLVISEAGESGVTDDDVVH